MNIQSAMKEAFGLEVNRVMRPTTVIGIDEPWLEVTYDGEHIGWLPVDTNINLAIQQGRRWLAENRAIRQEAASVRTPGAASVIISNHLTGGTS